MKKLMFVVVSLGLAFGSAACKKEEKKTEGEPKVTDKGDKPADPGKPADPALTNKPADPAAPKDQAPPAAADGLKLAWKAPAVGSKSETNDELLTKMNITVQPGQALDMVMTRTHQTHQEIVEVSPEGVPTKVKVHYAKREETQAMQGKTETKPSPIAGKAYVVWSEGGAIKATHDDGSAVSPDELKELDEEHRKELGQKPGMAEVLLSKTWKTGEKVTLTPDEIKIMTRGDTDKMVPQSVFITLTGVDAGVASFEMEILGAMEDAEGKMEAPMKMAVKLDVANVRPTEMSMTGTLGGKVKGMDTKGTIEGTKTFTYQ